MPTTQAFEDAYRKLNPEQKRAVDTIEGPVMVIAGPGTGKTQVLTLRVGNILQRTDVAPGNILCLTFTDAAAVNMRERLSALIGSAGYKVAVHTFHGFAREVIASFPEYFYNGADFIAADELVQIELMESVFGELKRTDPLSAKHEDEYNYLKDARRAIGLLKQAGLSPDEFADLIARNEKELPIINAGLTKVFGDRLTKQSIEESAKLVDKLSAMPEKSEMPTLASMIAISLGRAMKLAHENEKTAPLSSWKEKWAKKDESRERVLKDTLYIEKMRSLAHVYKRYREVMYAGKFYDFDDMLLDVLEMLKKEPTLLAMLEERYQYILVDEFQDTNDAQLKLVRLLGSAEVNEGRPNIMIVGDDDQAIYRFQGAEISNILDFPKFYKGPTLVVLTKNYRSTQKILDVAREVIEKSEERLESVLPELEKRLRSSNPELAKGGHIVHTILPTRAHEHAYIAREIGRLIKEGIAPSEIAVITRRHRELEDIARVLVSLNIPITYERKQNVFDEPHIRILVTMSRFVASIVAHRNAEADEYLPEILTAPFFDLSREDVWRISVSASQRKDHSWLGAMRDDPDTEIQRLARWLMELGSRAQHEPLERILDEMIGSDGVLSVGDDDNHEESQTPYKELPKRERSFISPFREHYFGRDARKRAEARYLMFLSSLRVFVGALREYKHGSQLFIGDLVEFADIHERNGIALSDTTPFASAEKAVNLMTAHKAKGLEFGTVFVASCQEDVWAGRGYPNKLPFPMNLPIERDEGGDDRLRLFYVALTRAKSHLFVTAYREDDAGKSSLKLGFVAPDIEKGALATHLVETDAEMSESDLAGAISILPTSPEFFPIVPGERAILMSLIKDYRMSVTHLNNFLNVADGGPALFLEQNLLRFPQGKSPSSAYGSAMHKAIEMFYRDLKRTKKLPSEEQLIQHFRTAMSEERLTESEHIHFLRAGEDALPIWYRESGKHANMTHESEVNFKSEGVVIEGAPLSGKIDKMIADGDTVLVFDFKTGKAKEKWEGKDAREKITLLNYRRQLIFYKLLVEHAHSYQGKKVERGVLEFIEPVDGKIKTLELDITSDDTDRLAKLIGAVHERIVSLDFPETEQYSKDVDGIQQFEEDLLNA